VATKTTVCINVTAKTMKFLTIYVWISLSLADMLTTSWQLLTHLKTDMQLFAFLQSLQRLSATRTTGEHIQTYIYGNDIKCIRSIGELLGHTALPS